jgi:hypothetical protein
MLTFETERALVARAAAALDAMLLAGEGRSAEATP